MDRSQFGATVIRHITENVGSCNTLLGVKVTTWLNVQMRPGVLQFKAGKVNLWGTVPALLFDKKTLIPPIQQLLVEAASSS